MKTYEYLLNTISAKGAAYLILLDPDRIKDDRIGVFIEYCEQSGVDGFLVGGSLMMNGDIEKFIKIIKGYTSLPAIIFPGSENQVTSAADALLYLSVISGRNAEHLIGKHVIAAPLIKKTGVEAISTGYMLIESGTVTTVQYMTGSAPIPRNKPEIAAATALAAEYMGMKFVYLEGGSGAQMSVPDEMIRAVSGYCTIPVICGGGIRTAGEAGDKVRSGASIIVTGNFFEDEGNWSLIKDFAQSVHVKLPVSV